MHAALTVLLDQHDRLAVDSGLSTAVWLGAVTRLPRRERQDLLVAADTLASLPKLRRAWDRGLVAWPIVALVCRKTARQSSSNRQIIDTRLADAVAALADEDGIVTGTAADQLIEVFHELLFQLQPATLAERERAPEFLALQPRIDGTGGTLFGDYQSVNFAAISDAIIAAAPKADLEANPHGEHRIGADNRRTLGQARAQGLLDLCLGANPEASNDTSPAASNDTSSAAGDDAGDAAAPAVSGVSAKVLATVSMETLLGLHRTIGDLLTRLVGGRLRLSASAAQRLADAGCDLRVVVHDDTGAMVGVGTSRRLAPGWLREAILAFHATCTGPGCRLPARECDLDHADEHRDEGPTSSGNLHPVHRGMHTVKTDRQWAATISKDHTVTWRHRGTGVCVTQPSLWTIRALATGIHPACDPTVPPTVNSPARARRTATRLPVQPAAPTDTTAPNDTTNTTGTTNTAGAGGSSRKHRRRTP